MSFFLGDHVTIFKTPSAELTIQDNGTDIGTKRGLCSTERNLPTQRIQPSVQGESGSYTERGYSNPDRA